MGPEERGSEERLDGCSPAAASGICSCPALLLRGLLFLAGANEDAGHAVVPLMTGGIEDHVAPVIGLAHLNQNGPRLGPRLRIVEGDFAPQIVSVHAREALDHLIRFGVRSTKALLEIRGF